MAHHYLSTACTHERHDYCAAQIGTQGEKRPAQCKFCEARCECACHRPAVNLRDNMTWIESPGDIVEP